MSESAPGRTPFPGRHVLDSGHSSDAALVARMGSSPTCALDTKRHHGHRAGDDVAVSGWHAVWALPDLSFRSCPAEPRRRLTARDLLDEPQNRSIGRAACGRLATSTSADVVADKSRDVNRPDDDRCQADLPRSCRSSRRGESSGRFSLRSTVTIVPSTFAWQAGNLCITSRSERDNH